MVSTHKERILQIMEALKKLIGPISNGRIDKNQAQKIGMKWRVDYRVSPSTGQFRLNFNMNFHSYKFYSFFLQCPTAVLDRSGKYLV